MVVLPDILLDEGKAAPQKDNLAHMIARFEQNGSSQVLVQKADEHVLYDYSVVECEVDTLHPGESARMTSIVEKPSRELQLNSIILLSDAMSFLPKFGPFWKEPNLAPGAEFS